MPKIFGLKSCSCKIIDKSHISFLSWSNFRDERVCRGDLEKRHWKQVKPFFLAKVSRQNYCNYLILLLWSVETVLTRRSKQCKSLIWIIILFSVLICYRICREEQLSRGTLLRGTLLWEILRDIDIWWYWVNIGRYWLVFGGTGSVWGSTGWYLVILGHFNLVLFGIKW